MGDMLAHDSVTNQAKTTDGYDFSPYFRSITPLLAGSDIIFCNAEIPVAGPRYGISGYPAFNAPTEFARDLKGAGCNTVNLATNHLADKGQGALNASIDQWQSLGVTATGANKSAAQQREVPVIEKQGLKIAFVAFADFSNAPLPAPYSINLYHDKQLVKALLTEARQKADIVMVSAHWGVEDSHTVSAAQRAMAQEFADLGADVIIGTGPHVIQPVTFLERAQGGRTLVWYSIGNMLSSQLHPDQLTGGVARMTLTKQNGQLIFSNVQFTGTFMSYEWSVADRAAHRLLARRQLRLQPLKDAVAETALFGVSVEERRQKLRQWLGADITELTIEP